MLQLHTFGRLSLTCDDKSFAGAASRRRSLALLTLIAASGSNGCSEEHALALLWPESDSARARNNLKQLIFSLRQAVGPNALARNGAMLTIDPSLIAVDLWDFERSVANGSHTQTIALYLGPFLNGFHIPGLREFENWVETERSRTTQMYVSAMERLAQQARALGDFKAELTWWRRLVMRDQFNDVYSRNLIRSLADSGDFVGALQHIRVHESLLLHELDVKPGAEFQRFVQELRQAHNAAIGSPITGPARPATPVDTNPSVTDPVANVETDHPPAIAAAVISADHLDAVTWRPDTTGDHRDLRRKQREPLSWNRARRSFASATGRWALAATVVAVALSVPGVARLAARTAGPGRLPGASVLVLPFDVQGDTASASLGTTVTGLLATGLDGSLGLRVTPVPDDVGDRLDSLRQRSGRSGRNDALNLIKRINATLYVSGAIVESDGRIRITAELHSRHADQLLERAFAEGSRRELFDLVDRVASQILASRVEGAGREVVHVASVTTSSLRAAKAYFAAEEAMRMGRFGEAIDSYNEALRLDTAFALAYYGLSGAEEMLGEDGAARNAANEAQRHAAKLPIRQRRLLAASLARQHGDVTVAERSYARLTVDYPDDVDAWLGLAEVRFHLNALRGRPATEARSAFERVTALDRDNAGAYLHLARIATLEGDSGRARRTTARARDLATDDALQRLALHVLSLGGRFMEFAPGQPFNPAPNRGPSAVDLLAERGTEGILAFAQRLFSHEAPPESRAYGLRLAALIEAGRGGAVRALSLLDLCGEADHGMALEARARLAALAFIPFDTDDVQRLRTEVFNWTPNGHQTDDLIDSTTDAGAHASLRLHVLGLLSLRLSDTGMVERMIGELDVVSRGPDMWTGRVLATSLRARLAAARGDSRVALSLLENAEGSRLSSASSAEAYDRLLHAQLLEQVGRDEDALGYYREFGERSPFDLPLVWQAELGMARIHARHGDRALAARYYRSVSTRLENADVPLRPSAQAAAQQAASLAMR